MRAAGGKYADIPVDQAHVDGNLVTAGMTRLINIRSYDPLDVVPFPVHPSLMWIVVHPNSEVLTEKARTILPEYIPLRSAIRQWGNVAGLVMGLAAGDGNLIGRCVEDVVAEPLFHAPLENRIDIYRTAGNGRCFLVLGRSIDEGI